MKSFASLGLNRRLNQNRDEVDTDGSWAVSYGDMITLLLTFFIVFFTLSPRDSQTQSQKLKQSLLENLKSSTFSETYKGVQPELSVGKEQKVGIDREVLKTWNGVAHDRGHYVLIEFPGVSFFKSGTTNLTENGIKALDGFVQAYMPYAGTYQLGIRAFADKRKVREGKRAFKDNLELTALRSVATMRVLQKSGIPLSRIKLGGYGEMLLTARDLASLPLSERSPSSELDLARTIVLVVEPETL